VTGGLPVNTVFNHDPAAHRRQCELLFYVEQWFEYMLYHHKTSLGWTRGAEGLESRHG
jgi:hypothetical protein